EAWPAVESPDELHEALELLGFLTEEEGRAGVEAPQQRRGEVIGTLGGWSHHLDRLADERRAAVLTTPQGKRLWVAAERLHHLGAVFSPLLLRPAIARPAERVGDSVSRQQALIE